MSIRPVEVSTLSAIPSFVPFGVFYHTADTGLLYVGTGSSGSSTTPVGGVNTDTYLAASTTQALSLSTGNLYVDATAGGSGITLTLPTAVGVKGRRITIIMVDTGAGGVTIATTSSQTINGGTSYALTNQWQSVELVSSGANWRVVASAG